MTSLDCDHLREHPRGSWLHAPMSMAVPMIQAMIPLAAGGWQSPSRHLLPLMQPGLVRDLIRYTPEPRRSLMVANCVFDCVAVADDPCDPPPDFDGPRGADSWTQDAGVLIDAAAVRLAHEASGVELCPRRLASMLAVLEEAPGQWLLPSWLRTRAGVADGPSPVAALESVLLLAPRIGSSMGSRIAALHPEAVLRSATIALAQMPRRIDRVVGLLHALASRRITTPLEATGQSAFGLLTRMVKHAATGSRRMDGALVGLAPFGPAALLAIAHLEPALGIDLARWTARRMDGTTRRLNSGGGVQARADGRPKFVTCSAFATRLAMAVIRVLRQHDPDRGRRQVAAFAVRGEPAQKRQLALRRMAGDAGIDRGAVLAMAAIQAGDEPAVARAAIARIRAMTDDAEAHALIATRLTRLHDVVAEELVPWLATAEDPGRLAEFFDGLLQRGDRMVVLRFLLAADRAARGRKPRDATKLAAQARTILESHDRSHRRRRRLAPVQRTLPCVEPLPLPSGAASRSLACAAAGRRLVAPESEAFMGQMQLTPSRMLVLLLDLLGEDPDAAVLRRLLVRRAVAAGKLGGLAAMRMLMESSVDADSPEAPGQDAAWRTFLKQTPPARAAVVVRRVIGAESSSAPSAPLVVLGEATGMVHGRKPGRAALETTSVSDQDQAAAILGPSPSAVADLTSLVGDAFPDAPWEPRSGEGPAMVFGRINRMVQASLGWVGSEGLKLLGEAELRVLRLRGSEDVGVAYLEPDTDLPVIEVTVNPILDRGVEGIAPVLGVGLHEIGHHLFDFGDPDAVQVLRRSSPHPLTRSLMNLLLDERLERRLRSMDLRYGRLLDRAIAHFIGRRRIDVPVLVIAHAERRRVAEVARDAEAGRYGGRYIAAGGRHGTLPADHVSLSITEVMAIPGLLSPLEEVLQGIRSGVPLERLSSRRAAVAVGMAREVDLRSMRLLQLEGLCDRMAKVLGLDRGHRRRASMPEWVAQDLGRAVAGLGGRPPRITRVSKRRAGRSMGRRPTVGMHSGGLGAENRFGGPQSRTFWMGTEGSQATFRRLTREQQLPFDPRKHAGLVESVRLPAATLRAALSRCGLVEVPVGGRRSGRPDRARLRRWMQQPTASVCTGRVRRTESDLALGILIDRSGSMQDRITIAHRFAAVVTEAGRGLSGVDGFVAAFDDQTFFDLGDLRGDVSIASLTAGGGNNDAGGLARTAERLRLVPGRQRVIVLISDGEPTACSVAAFHQVAARIEREGIRIVHVAVAPLRPDVLLPRHIDLADEQDIDHAVTVFGALIEAMATGRLRRLMGAMAEVGS